MAKKPTGAEPAVRKSFLVFGGIVIGVAVIGFVVSTFVLGGGGGGETTNTDTPANTTTDTSGTSGNPAAVPGSDGVPATGGTTTGNAPKNELKPGGRNPFSATSRITPSSSTSGTTSVAAAATKPVAEVKPHTWQMLELEAGAATILVDGKKKIVKVGDELTAGYKLNSVTGKCVTVKGKSVFGLCPGAQPITL